MKNNKSKLKEVLIKRKMTQADLANKTGIMPYQINKLVKDKDTNLFLSTAKKICKETDSSLDELFNEEAYKNRENFIVLDELGDIYAVSEININITQACNDGELTMIRLRDLTIYKHGHWIPLDTYDEKKLEK